ncbi:DUF397 domain-containing protein [Micromonospora echinofusca]|uniref:DUF397 domain-containing protein n=1 Tax=Micromonospora echinofusca TaxID=47858 RepID=UPI00341BF2F8
MHPRPSGPALVFAPTAWRAFVAQVAKRACPTADARERPSSCRGRRALRFT